MADQNNRTMAETFISLIPKIFETVKPDVRDDMIVQASFPDGSVAVKGAKTNTWLASKQIHVV